MSGSPPLNAAELQQELALLRQRVTELEAGLADCSQNTGGLKTTRDQLDFNVFSAMSFDGIIVCDEEGRIVEWNPAAERIFDRSAQTVLGLTLWELRHLTALDEFRTPEALRQLEDEFYQFAKTGRSPWNGQSLENHVRRPDGSVVITNTMIFSIPGRQGYMFGGIIRDVTDAKRREAKYLSIEHELEQRYRSLFDNLLFGVILAQTNGIILSANPQACKLLGMTEEEIRQAGRSEIMVMDEKLSHAMQVHNKYGQVMAEITLRRKDGTTFPAEGTISQYLDADGIRKTCISFHDISVRKQTEERLQKSERMFRSLVENIHDMVCEVDAHANYLYLSPSYQRILGYDPAELIGKNVTAIVHPEEHEPGFKKLRKLLSEGSPRQDVVRYRHKNGEWRWIESRGSVIEAASGKPTVVIVSRDITDRLEAERKLSESEAALRKAQEVAKLGSWKWYIQENRLELSDELSHMIGVLPQPDDPLAFIRKIRQRIHPEDLAVVNEVHRQAMEGQGFSPFEIRMTGSDDGLYRTVYAEAGEPFLDIDGEIQYLTGIVQDITERKVLENHLAKQRDELAQTNQQLAVELEERRRAEAALRENRRLTQAILDHSPSLIYVKDLEGRLVLVNRQMEKLFHRTRDELVGITGFDFQPKEMAEEYYLHDLQVIQTGIAGQFEEFTDSPSGRRVFLSEKFPLFDENLNITGVCGLSSDITERRAAEDALREAEWKYKIVAENTTDWVFWIDPSGKYIYNSPSCELITGYPAESFILDPELATRMILPEDLKIYQDHKKEILTGHTGRQISFRILRKDGEVRWLEHACQPVFGPEGNFLGERGSNRDFTERKHAESLLKELEVLRGIDKLRDELISNVSHELRTPLGLILVMVTALRKNDLVLAGEVRQEFLEDIEEETRSLQKIVSNLLDTSLLQSGRLVLNIKAINLGKLISRLVEQMRLHSPQHTILYKHPSRPVYAEVDAQRIEQVLLNLLDNAVKYSPAGKTIEVTLSQSPVDARVQVRDQGKALPHAEYERIFDRFYRIVDRNSPMAAGLGLGLPISRGIVQAHGGKLWGEGSPEGGSIFTFTLPCSQKKKGTLDESC